MRSVASSDGVQVAVHELRAADAPTLLISHATGFHGWCYAPVANALGDAYRSICLDYRGHGDTPQPEGLDVDWDRYADDVQAVAAALPGPVRAFGHSMGGACLLMAALRDPTLFSGLVLYEPVVPPPGTMPTSRSGGENMMAGAASRRRATFPSYAAALDNYASKPPLNGWRADALYHYVHHGFRPVDDGVTLKCTPRVEAGTFATAPDHVWESLDQVQVPVTVLAGRQDGTPPPSFAEPIARRIPGATFLRMEDLDHFGPMSNPNAVAVQIVAALAAI